MLSIVLIMIGNSFVFPSIHYPSSLSHKWPCGTTGDAEIKIPWGRWSTRNSRRRQQMTRCCPGSIVQRQFLTNIINHFLYDVSIIKNNSEKRYFELELQNSKRLHIKVTLCNTRLRKRGRREEKFKNWMV